MASTRNRQKREEDLLAQAAGVARRGMKRGWGGPFGAVILKRGRVISTGCNQVLRRRDATCHAEITAIREASKKLRTFDLGGCDIFSTTEPCPMCFSAIHWARIKRVVYSTTIADVKRLGFNELTVSNALMKRVGRSPVRIERRASDACRALLREWSALPKKRTY